MGDTQFTVIVETPRRLHLGLIDPGGAFGGIGVGLEGGYTVRVMRDSRPLVKASEEDRATVLRAMKGMDEHFGTGMRYAVEVIKKIPRHVGFGSTTQLTLAVGMAIARLNSLNVPVEYIATVLGRGEVSGVGTYVFKHGGFIVEGGRDGDGYGGFPSLVLSEPFPEDWAFVLVRPLEGRGLDEVEEREAIEGVAVNRDRASLICYHILMGLLPAIRGRDIFKFGRHLTEIQGLVGEYFSAEQGGKFREDVASIMSFLNDVTYGGGQSSWGPTVYGLIRTEEFKKVNKKVRAYLEGEGIRADVELGIPRNMGALIKVLRSRG